MYRNIAGLNSCLLIVIVLSDSICLNYCSMFFFFFLHRLALTEQGGVGAANTCTMIVRCCAVHFCRVFRLGALKKFFTQQFNKLDVTHLFISVLHVS